MKYLDKTDFDGIIQRAREEVSREEYIRRLTIETDKLRQRARRPLWRRIYDAVIPFTVTINWREK